MQPQELARALGYIDAHLDGELHPDELASLAGYSPRHFARLFKAATGETPSRRVRARRLRRALCEMARGTAAIDAVLRYGFDTYAGFYKAFVRAYGCSPRAYLRIYDQGLPPEREWGRIIMPTKDELKRLLGSWPDHADEDISFIPIDRGRRLSDTAFRVGQGAVLKLYRDEARLTKVLRLAERLGAQGQPAQTPISTREGLDRVAWNGLFAALVRRVPGAPLGAEAWFGPDGGDRARQAGRALARLHAALGAAEGGIDAGEGDPYRECRDWAVPLVRRQDAQWNLGLGAAFFDDYLEAFGRLAPELPRQLIHRDPNPGNLMYEGGRFSGFVDFDLCQRNARLFDLCYVGTGILSECGGGARYERWPDLLRAIARGYGEVAPLTEAERRGAFYMVLSIQLICCAYFDGVDDPVIKGLAATSRRMLTFIAANRDRIELR